MPVLEPIEREFAQTSFERGMISAELERLFRHVMKTEEKAHVDDVADVMDELDDEQLSAICQTPAGHPVESVAESLEYSCELRQRLFDELAEIDLTLPEALEGTPSGCGWLDELLGEQSL